MANGVWFGSSEMDTVKLGSSTVDKIYLGTDLVWPTASGVASATITTVGSQKWGAGTYATTQTGTSGSGSGATFNITIDSDGEATAISSITAAGTGYAVSDTITLVFTSIPSNRQITAVVLTVASLG